MRVACFIFAGAMLAGCPWPGAKAASLIQFVDSGQRLIGNTNGMDVALSDLDGDGDLDAVVANRPTEIWINQGGAQGGTPGTFLKSGQSFDDSGLFGRVIELADLDQDGDLDIFLAQSDDLSPDAFGFLRIFLNQGGIQGGLTGQFRLGSSNMVLFAPAAVALGPLRTNAAPDAFVVLSGVEGSDQIWFNDGTGRFTKGNQSFRSPFDSDVALGDLDGDGDLDAVVSGGTGARLLINQGGAQHGAIGTFVDGGQRLGNSGLLGVALADLDGDGDLDVFVGRSGTSGQAEVWINQGGRQGSIPGTFILRSQMFPMSSGRKTALGDLDRDGDLDAFVPSSSTSRIYENDGTGLFVDTGVALGPDIITAIALGDLDGDGYLDAFVVNASGTNTVWINQSVAVPVPIYSSAPAPGALSDFGEWDVHHLPNFEIGRTIRIGNVGTADLRIDSIGFAGGTPYFTIGSLTNEAGVVQLPYTIPAGVVSSTSSFLSVTIIWNPPDQLVESRENLQVFSNDPNTPLVAYPFHFAVGNYSDERFTVETAIFILLGQARAGGGAIARSAGLLPLAFNEVATDTLLVDTNSALTLNAEVPSFLGGGSILLSNFFGRVTVSRLPIPSDSQRAVLRIEGGQFTAPSVRLPAGLETGPNTLTFGPASQSDGLLNLVTGEYTASATATIVNRLLPQGCLVHGNYRGTFDFVTGRATLQSQSADYFRRSDQLQFSRTARTLWLSWANRGVLETATDVAGPWSPLGNAASPFAVNLAPGLQQFFRLRVTTP